MASYKITWKNSARKELKGLDRKIIPRILKAVETLASNPYPVGAKKISGSDHTYRIRVGNYRIIYNILSSILFIEVIKIGHRKNIYK